MSKDFPPEPAEIGVYRTQGDFGNPDNRTTEIFDVNLRVRIPTISRANSLVRDVLGGKREALIVSPRGYLASPHYLKPVLELTRDLDGYGLFSGEGKRRAKSTREDTERYELLANSAFRGELSQAGWMIFPEIQNVEEWDPEHARLGDEKGYKREFALTDFIGLLRLVGFPALQEGIDFRSSIDDLTEVAKFLEDGRVSFVWDRYDHFFFLPAKQGGKHYRLFLTGVDDTSLLGHRGETNTLLRMVSINSPPLRSGKDLAMLAREYADSKGINLGCQTNPKNPAHCSFVVTDRKSGEKVTAPDTGKLLAQATDFSDFVDRLILDKKLEVEQVQQAQLAKRRERYGLPAKPVI